jgi:sulfate transport system substrate-binding protein
MTSLKIKTLLASLALAASGVASAQNQLLNVSYDVAREFYKDYQHRLHRPLQEDHRQGHQDRPVARRLQRAGARRGRRAGRRRGDDEHHHRHRLPGRQGRGGQGLARQKFPNGASPTTSTMLFLVRNGNPKGIKDWDDLIKPGVQVIVVNPKTGGNGRYAYLAAWGQVRAKGGTDAQAPSS